MAALIGQTPVLIHVYSLISFLFSVVLPVTFLFRSYKLILLINIHQSQCQCIIQNQLCTSMFIQPISVNLHIFLMWHIPFCHHIRYSTIQQSSHFRSTTSISANSPLKIYVYVFAHHSYQPTHTRILQVAVIIPVCFSFL